jgi:hypothetical protein
MRGDEHGRERRVDGVEGLAAAVAAHGLATSAPALPREPLDDDEWRALVDLVAHGRITGWLERVIADGSLAVTPGQADEAATMHLSATGLVALLEGFLAELVAMLDIRSIESRVLKGPAVARLDYPDRRLRTFGDVDLLVRGCDFDRAVATLEHAGLRRRFVELRPGFDARFGKGVPLARGDGFELDLHRTFADGPFGLRTRPDELFADGVFLDIAGRPMLALSREDRLVHACFHVALSGDLRLSSVRDVAQLVLAGELDVDRVRTRIESWHADPVLARGITRAWTKLGLTERTPLVDWAEHFDIDAPARRALSASAGAGAGWPMKALEGWRAVPGLRSKLAYTGALVWPSASFMRERQLGRATRWRGALAQVRPWLRLDEEQHRRSARAR